MDSLLSPDICLRIQAAHESRALPAVFAPSAAPVPFASPSQQEEAAKQREALERQSAAAPVSASAISITQRSMPSETHAQPSAISITAKVGTSTSEFCLIRSPFTFATLIVLSGVSALVSAGAESITQRSMLIETHAQPSAISITAKVSTSKTMHSSVVSTLHR